jgi:hypothetical protein
VADFGLSSAPSHVSLEFEQQARDFGRSSSTSTNPGVVEGHSNSGMPFYGEDFRGNFEDAREDDFDRVWYASPRAHRDVLGGASSYGNTRRTVGGGLHAHENVNAHDNVVGWRAASRGAHHDVEMTGSNVALGDYVRAHQRDEYAVPQGYLEGARGHLVADLVAGGVYTMEGRLFTGDDGSIQWRNTAEVPWHHDHAHTHTRVDTGAAHHARTRGPDSRVLDHIHTDFLSSDDDLDLSRAHGLSTGGVRHAHTRETGVDLGVLTSNKPSAKMVGTVWSRVN